MATCPKCGGHLTSRHRCRRTTEQTVIDAVLSAAAGGFWALAMAALFDRGGLTADADMMFFFGGAVIGATTQAWLRRR
ncbi:MAG: hypothetical protein NUW22_12780 [Acidobacteria bacterium]|nr:hypothetical protein [Acidobacteriota bacterium]